VVGGGGDLCASQRTLHWAFLAHTVSTVPNPLPVYPPNLPVTQSGTQAVACSLPSGNFTDYVCTVSTPVPSPSTRVLFMVNSTSYPAGSTARVP